MSMFTIFTESSSERDILQKDFANIHDRFHIKLNETPAIAGILRSISYELFQAAPPPLAQHVTKIAIDSLHLKLSLALYRQVLSSIKKKEQLLALYRQYFLSLTSLLEEHNTQQPAAFFAPFDEETSAIWSLQQFEASPSENILITDIQEQLQKAAGKHYQLSPMQKTRKTAEEDLNMNSLSAKQRLDLTKKQILNEWEAGEWKQREENAEDSSREITRIQRLGKRDHVLQHSITDLITEDAIFEREREEEMAKAHKKSEESMRLKFNRRMREKIVHAKLKRKRK